MNVEYTGKKIAELRRNKNLTQKELAEQLHVTDKAVSKWERGVNFPDLGLIEELAAALDSTPSILLGLEDATQEEIVTSFAEISSQQSEEASKDIQKVGWLNLFAGLFLVVGMCFVNVTMEPKGVYHESKVVQWVIYSLISVVVIGALCILGKYKAMRKFTGVDMILAGAVAIDAYAFLVIRLFAERNPTLLESAILIAIAIICVQFVFYRVMVPHWMKLLPLVFSLYWTVLGIYLEAVEWNLIVYFILPAVCCFITWFICRRRDKQKERLLSCIKPYAIVFTVALVFIAGVALAGLVGGIKSSSVTINVEEEVSLPISIFLECNEETIVLYENDSIESTAERFPEYSAPAEGTIWLTIGDKKYEILSFLDHVNRPIVEITGDGTEFEVFVYTTLYQNSKDVISQSTNITIQE